MNRAVAIVAAAALAALLLVVAVVVLFLGTGAGAAGTTAAAMPGAAASDAAGASESGPVASGAEAAANEALGAQLAAARGWDGPQDTCLDELWTRESGWQATARNPSSGAYGIAQALGHLNADGPETAGQISLNLQGDNYPPAFAAGNPAQFGGSSDAAAQISWGLGYIASAYGTPCGGWAHEETDGWY